MGYRILYIVNFLDSQPQYNLSRFLSIQKNCEVHVLLLPSLQTATNKFQYKASYQKDNELVKIMDLSVKFSMPIKVQLTLHYFLNFLVGVIFIGKQRFKYDYGIGETNFGGFMIFILKKLRKVRKSIFMNGDVIIQNTTEIEGKKLGILEKIQIFLRRIAYKNDLIWYVSSKVQDYDKNVNLNSIRYIISPGLTVNTEDLLRNIKNPIKTYDIAYIGRLGKETGIDLLLEAVHLLKISRFDLQVVIIGGSEVKITEFKNKCLDLDISHMVQFLGIVESRKIALEYLGKSMFGYAMYEPTEINPSKFTDNGKIVDYIQAGIPAIITKGFNSEKLEIKNENIIEVEFNSHDLALFLRNVANRSSVGTELYIKLINSTVNHGISLDSNVIYEKLWTKITNI